MKIGFVNGCFDVLHVGHISLLEFAKGLCDHLVVGIDSDDRAALAKGPSRPFNNESDRLRMLLALSCVDEVKMFSTDKELIELVKKTEPDVMVVGSDWEGKKVIGAEYAKDLKFFRKINGYSTTRILENSLNR